MKEIDIKKLNVQELKALAYDLIAEKERAQNSLNIVNQEIQLRMNEGHNHIETAVNNLQN